MSIDEPGAPRDKSGGPRDEPGAPRDEPGASRSVYRDRIAVLPGDPPVAYRPGVVLVDEEARARLQELAETEGERYDVEPIFVPSGDEGEEMAEPPPFGQWYRVSGVDDAPALVDRLAAAGYAAELDIVYFASDADCCGCPPHPALAAEIAAEGWGASPWRANPWRANPWRANPWRANPWRANAEALNLLATGKPPMSSVMPAPERVLPRRPVHPNNSVRIGVLDSGLAGGRDNADGYRPALLGDDQPDLRRISGELDVPSQPIGGHPADKYLDPVAGHGTFIAGIIEQLTPGCTIRVLHVFEPEGDVAVSTLARALHTLLAANERPTIVNFSFGGTGRSTAFERVIEHFHRRHGVVFVAAAGNEGSCVEQYPAALPYVIGVAGLGPDGPAEWSNYGRWVDACAPGTDIVSCFFAGFDGDLPRINGIDADDFVQWATWTGTSFAAPVVVAALAREMVTTNCSAGEAVERVIRAPHLAALPLMGTIVNY
jgi:hypothetical protein